MRFARLQPQVSAMLRLRSLPDASIRPIPKETGLMIIFDNPATVPAPAGQYTHLARLDLGYKTMLQLSGQVAIDADGKIVGPTICSPRLITSWTTSPRSSLLKGS